MRRRAFHRSVLLAAAGAAVPLSGRDASATADPARSGAAHLAPGSRSVTEYRLPPAVQTHEIVRVPGTAVVLISQMSDSILVKLWLDPATERVVAIHSILVGTPNSELHGLGLSRAYPGMVWATLQRDNKLLLIDPGAGHAEQPPRIVRTIDVPAPGFGPHFVGEDGDLLWSSLKYASPQTGKYYALAISHTDPSRYRLYEALPQPVFIAPDPTTGQVYVSQDASSSVMRIDPANGATTQIPIPALVGSTPVGLIRATGPLTGIWTVLLGSADGGTGTFGRIEADDTITWFRLTSPVVRNAGLLHLAADTRPSTRPALLLLSSSLASLAVPDTVIRVTFDPAATTVVGEEVACLPTQQCAAHRVTPLTTTVMATELASSTVAQLRSTPEQGPAWTATSPATGSIEELD
jgi:streptogramin lyase